MHLMVDLIIDIQHGETGSNDTLILVIGIIGTLLNLACLLFNVALAIALFKARKELAQNPFYDCAPHLLLAEGAYQVASLAILGPCMLLGTEYRGYYLATLSQRYVAGAFLLAPYEAYYYLQFIIAVYRLFSVGSTKYHAFFEKRSLHAFCGAAWVLCIGACVYQVLSPCMRVFRPRYHSTLAFCFDETRIRYNRTGEIPASWHVVQATTLLDTALPMVTMVIYALLFVRIGLYTMERTTETFDSLTRLKLFVGFSGGDRRSRQEARVVHQGLLLLLFLSVEPAWNVVFTYYVSRGRRARALQVRPVSSPAYILGAYYCIYMHVLPNFITFIVFNRQTRGICARTLRDCGCRLRYTESRKFTVSLGMPTAQVSSANA